MTLCLVGIHRLQLKPVMEREGETQGKKFFACRIECVCDGIAAPEATAGAIGVAEIGEDPVAIAFGDWYMGFARAYFRALAKQSADCLTDGWMVYAGASGFRGERPDGWLDSSIQMHVCLVHEIAAAVPDSDFVIVDLKASVQTESTTFIEARVDGLQSPRLESLLRKVSWPFGRSPYLFKQTYVLKKSPPKKALEPTRTSDRRCDGFKGRVAQR